MHFKFEQDAYARIFGDQGEKEEPGKRRLCKTCGGWHLLSAWPHNCREPNWRPPQVLKAPRIINDIEPHVEGGVYIGSRNEQRTFMRDNDLVEFETFDETAGTHKQDTNSKEYEADLVQDIKRAIQEDPLNRPPPVKIEEANEHVTEDEKVSTDDIEVIE